jgi:predicted HAD superfamily Cof-like phosphohydrolase
MTIESIALWHKRARPSPTDDQFQVQLGCHFEEIIEQLETIRSDNDYTQFMIDMTVQSLTLLSRSLKKNTASVWVDDPVGFLDAAVDQIVTSVGVAHCANMDVIGAVKEVDSSNWSKYDEDGMPLFDDFGKISKGPNYVPPSLTSFINQK